MNEHELFMELISDITNELDIDTLCHKILVNVCILTNSDRASLFLAKGSRDRRYLVAQLFDVTPECLLEDALMAAEEYKKIPPLPFGKHFKLRFLFFNLYFPQALVLLVM